MTLAEIRARLEATSRPWFVADAATRSTGYVVAVLDKLVVQSRPPRCAPTWFAPNAEFIANAPTDIAALLAIAEAAQELATQWVGWSPDSHSCEANVLIAALAALDAGEGEQS